MIVKSVAEISPFNEVCVNVTSFILSTTHIWHIIHQPKTLTFMEVFIFSLKFFKSL